MLPQAWAGKGQLLGVRLQSQPARPPQAEVWLLSDGSPADNSRFVVQPVGGAPGGSASTGELYSRTGSQPWLWWPRAGYLLVDVIPLQRGRQRIRLESGPLPAAGAAAPTGLDLGEVEVP
jgi:hypothetical protein